MNKYMNAFQKILFDKNNSLLFFAIVLGTFFTSLVLGNFLADMLLRLVELVFSKTKFNFDKDDLAPAKKPLKTFFCCNGNIFRHLLFCQCEGGAKQQLPACTRFCTKDLSSGHDPHHFFRHLFHRSGIAEIA